MRVDEVPQQPNGVLEGGKKAMYAVGEDGSYAIVQSAGWEAEELVTTAAVEFFDQLAQDAWRRAEQGLCSPLEYYMYRRRMDVPTLAQSTGFWQWRIKRHLKRPFTALNPRLQHRYADALGLSVAQLGRLQQVDAA